MKLKFFFYELKRSIWPMVILTILGLLINIPAIITEDYSGLYANTNLNNFMVFLSIACVVTPVYEFAFLNKKRSIDNYYSLPLKRQSIIMFKFTCGYIKILLSYSITFFIGFMFIVIRHFNFYIEYYLSFYFLSVLLGLSLYAFFTFIYTRANSIIDGIIFIVFYLFIFTIVLNSVRELFYDLFNINFGRLFYDFSPFNPLSKLASMYDKLIKYGSLASVPGGYGIKNDWIYYLIWSIFGSAALVGLYFSPIYDKAERAEQVSNSYFGYRLIIPIGTVLFLYNLNLKPFRYASEFALIAIYAFIVLTLYIIYQRTFKLSLKYWLIYLATIIIGFVLTSL